MGNQSHSGGGIAVEDGGKIALEGGIICSNSALKGTGALGDGGGICVHPGGTMKMMGGIVSANYADGCGGGVMLEGQAFEEDNLVLVGGSIHGNAARTRGGGVAVCGKAMFSIRGVADVRRNTEVLTENTHTVYRDSNIYLADGNVVNILGSFRPSEPLGAGAFRAEPVRGGSPGSLLRRKTEIKHSPARPAPRRSVFFFPRLCYTALSFIREVPS